MALTTGSVIVTSIRRMVCERWQLGQLFHARKNRGPEGSGAGLEASWAILGHLGDFWRRLGPSWNLLGGLLGRLGPRKVANMGPTWLPKRSKNRCKIGPKIDQFHDASWNGSLSVLQ